MKDQWQVTRARVGQKAVAFCPPNNRYCYLEEVRSRPAPSPEPWFQACLLDHSVTNESGPYPDRSASRQSLFQHTRRSLPRFVDLLLTWGAGMQIPHAISDAGYWNAWDIWLRGQDLNL